MKFGLKILCTKSYLKKVVYYVVHSISPSLSNYAILENNFECKCNPPAELVQQENRHENWLIVFITLCLIFAPLNSLRYSVVLNNEKFGNAQGKNIRHDEKPPYNVNVLPFSSLNILDQA